MTVPTLLAAGFVVDRPGEGTLFPSAGGNSADPRVQAVYWRCLVVLFASARICNPDQRLALFTNSDLPNIGNVDLARVFASYGVEVHRVPLTARLPEGRSASWGNVLYFFDAMQSLGGESDDLRVALVDSDVVVTGPLGGLFGLLDRARFAAYDVGTAPDQDVNGLTPCDMARIAWGDAGPRRGLIHYGGELFCTSIGAWKQHCGLFADLILGATAPAPDNPGPTTEEHVFSIALARLAEPVGEGARVIKRMWTSPRYRTVEHGDEGLPLWHLPAEKRFGLFDLYRWLEARNFPSAMDPAAFRSQAARMCGIPGRSPWAAARDRIRRAVERLR